MNTADTNIITRIVIGTVVRFCIRLMSTQNRDIADDKFVYVIKQRRFYKVSQLVAKYTSVRMDCRITIFIKKFTKFNDSGADE